MSYEPAVPSTVSITLITDEQYAQIMAQTHYFNVESANVLSVSAEVITQKEIEITNGQEREFLNSTDWKVLRHIRQKALGITTSLTEEQYLTLESQREEAASRIV
jgi:predicted nucleotidyltransferase